MTQEPWKPIGTAPRDGTLIQIREGQWQPVHARWQDGRWRVIEYHGTQRPTQWRHANGETREAK